MAQNNYNPINFIPNTYDDDDLGYNWFKNEENRWSDKDNNDYSDIPYGFNQIMDLPKEGLLPIENDEEFTPAFSMSKINSTIAKNKEEQRKNQERELAALKAAQEDFDKYEKNVNLNFNPWGDIVENQDNTEGYYAKLKENQIDAYLSNNLINVYSNINKLDLKVPNWGVDNWIEERLQWQRQLESATGERGWFYFKVFFDFNAGQGLLDNINNTGVRLNSAMHFLDVSKNLYPSLKLKERQVALKKFGNLLQHISNKSPWFIKSIKGLDKINPVLNDYSKDKTIELSFLEDSIDMRINTLLDLYRFVAYDEINCKEILPENLRKFDISIIIFNSPFKKLQGPISSISNSDNISSKNLLDNGNNRYGDNTLTYKLFTLKNCEINLDSLGTSVASDLSNESPFNLGNNSITLKYDRAYIHSGNEFFGTFFGSTGFYYNLYSINNKKGLLVNDNELLEENTGIITQNYRLLILRELLENPTNYKDIVFISDYISNHIFKTIQGNKSNSSKIMTGDLGNAYINPLIKELDKFVKEPSIKSNFKNLGKGFLKDSIKKFFSNEKLNPIIFNSISNVLRKNILDKKLLNLKNGTTPNNIIFNTETIALKNDKVFQSKIKNLKNGTNSNDNVLFDTKTIAFSEDKNFQDKVNELKNNYNNTLPFDNLYGNQNNILASEKINDKLNEDKESINRRFNENAVNINSINETLNAKHAKEKESIDRRFNNLSETIYKITNADSEFKNDLGTRFANLFKTNIKNNFFGALKNSASNYF